jgi:hypothetical protein
LKNPVFSEFEISESAKTDGKGQFHQFAQSGQNLELKKTGFFKVFSHAPVGEQKIRLRNTRKSSTATIGLLRKQRKPNFVSWNLEIFIKVHGSV